ncbi:phosphatase PAP2 family protein [Cupriavidus metallidurans]|jgi:PAP2 superfamily|uniref:phosphatase PAP2 family protein n=1 Tax=Cupriavidus metallidurans TaxID=119219 RepID=UPI00079847EF|nr:phosphatase PAP2 family protein [Cupriavidus metallidurans]KWW39858.1 hypothetical protein AU374_00083 [Cupriavidus metallidurans]
MPHVEVISHFESLAWIFALRVRWPQGPPSLSQQYQKIKTTMDRSNLRRYLIGWFLTLLLAGVDWIWLSATEYDVEDGLAMSTIQSAIGLLLVSTCLYGVSRINRYAPLTEKIRLGEIANVTCWVVLLACFIVACNTLQYLCTTVGAPLVDETLLAFDRALGFEWLTFYRWVHSYETLRQILAAAYLSFYIQLLTIPIILGLTRHHAELSEFVLLIMLAEALLLIISTAVPASSTFVYFGITAPNTSETVSHFHLLRNGSLQIINPVQGLVSLPSFHTMVAIICTYALRRLPTIFPLAVMLNVVMIASTPTQGGHYLADVLAGIACGVAVILVFRKVSDRAMPIRAMVRRRI